MITWRVLAELQFRSFSALFIFFSCIRFWRFEVNTGVGLWTHAEHSERPDDILK